MIPERKPYQLAMRLPTKGTSKEFSFKSMKPKLSRVATFDDLLRNARVLRDGCEQEFRSFVRTQEDCRKKWHAAEQKVESMQEKVQELQADLNALNTRLKHALNTIDKEMYRRKHAEQDRDSLEQQLNKVRELLFDKENKSIRMNEHDRERLSAFVNTSNLRSNYNTHNEYESPQKLNTIMESSCSMLDDIDYDQSEGDIDMAYPSRRYKRRSPTAPPIEDFEGRSSPKRHRSDDHNNSIVTTTTITVNGSGKPVSASTEVNVPKLNKSFSEPALDKHLQTPVNDRDADSEPESDDSFFGTPRNRNNSRTRKGILKRTPSHPDRTPVLGRSSSAGKGLNRVHVFISRTFIKPETCVPCGKRIRFGKLAMKCKDCKATCHPDCKDQLPLPCMPNAPSTPGAHQKAGGLISDFTPSDSPMIPSLVVHCVNEVETRGLSEVGIYRVPGSDREVKDLKEKFFKGKGVPRLNNILDIHVVCGCLKDFLRGLKEPLVTYKLWLEFAQSAEIADRETSQRHLYSLVEHLPQANRDTLAFLCLHLQKIAECPECKMPISNLAKVFGPTLVGYSTPEPEPMQMINETRRQNMVMENLLELSGEFWVKFLNIEDTSLYPLDPNTPNTPDCSRAAVPRSRLGPVLTPGSYEAETQRTQTWSRNTTQQTPRLPSRHNNTTQRPRQFFTSPFVSN
ncbi:rac GTPase-activating protein 1-like isoform X2 [Haliotis rufescens]|uniref:rac GTPase-activating protein 1-like isoform X2 n=1 Tax=Haliotis rufescens TaxID=6454 RepID=UPI00201F1D79|nr:rac GTPase-activating protein 1-like isoform X2 [Haliotis rufescens]